MKVSVIVLSSFFVSTLYFSSSGLAFQPLSPEGNSQTDYRAKVVRTRLILWRTPQDNEVQMLLIDWKNTGTQPIGEVKANVTFYDDENRELENVKDTLVFLTRDPKKTIKPGQLYQEPQGEGLVYIAIPPKFTKALKAEAVITRVSGIPIV